MAEVKVSKGQLDRLGAKLDQLGEQLTEDDRRLLITVFGLAARELGTVQGEARTLPSLSDGLRSAFSPSEAARFTLADDEGVEVGGEVKWSK
jgi:hypothetical protein